MASLDALYITVNGHTQRLTDPSHLERAIREIVRPEIRELQDEGFIFDRSDD